METQGLCFFLSFGGGGAVPQNETHPSDNSPTHGHSANRTAWAKTLASASGSLGRCVTSAGALVRPRSHAPHLFPSPSFKFALFFVVLFLFFLVSLETNLRLQERVPSKQILLRGLAEHSNGTHTHTHGWRHGDPISLWPRASSQSQAPAQCASGASTSLQ